MNRSRLAGRLRAPALLSLLDQGLVSGFGFLSGIVVARLAGLEDFGRFALVVIAVGFAQAVHDTLVASPMLTLSGARGRLSAPYHRSLLAANALLSLASGGAALAILAAVFGLRDGALPWPLLAAAGLLSLGQTTQYVVRRILFARGQGGRALAMDALRVGLFFFGAGALLLLGSAPSAASLVGVLGASALLAALPFAFGGLPAGRSRARPAAVARRHAPLARWLFPIIFVSFAQEQLVAILAGASLGDEALGGLRAAQSLVGLVLLGLAAAENVLPASAARAYAARGGAGLSACLARAALGLGLPVLGVLAILAAAPSTWLGLVFGEGFRAYGPTLRILALGAALIFARDMAAQLFRARKRTGPIFASALASLAASLAVLQPFLAGWGVAGAAAAIVAGHGAGAAFLVGAALWSGRPRSRANGAEAGRPA